MGRGDREGLWVGGTEKDCGEGGIEKDCGEGDREGLRVGGQRRGWGIVGRGTEKDCGWGDREGLRVGEGEGMCTCMYHTAQNRVYYINKL